MQDYVVSELRMTWRNYKDAPHYVLREALEEIGFRFLGSGSFRAVYIYEGTNRVFKIATRYEGSIDNRSEYMRYRREIHSKDKPHFAKMRNIFEDGWIVETKKAQGRLAADYDNDTVDEVREKVIEPMKSKYDLVDMHRFNYFILGSIRKFRVTITDYACYALE